jgi:hypothetical protein
MASVAREEKVVLPHVAAGVALLGAVLAALHPGFTLPPDTATTATAVLTAVFGGIEGICAFFHKGHAQQLAIVKMLAAKAISDAAATGTKEETATTTGSTTVTETVTPSPAAAAEPTPPAPVGTISA